jgi:hypothetical protein
MQISVELNDPIFSTAEVVELTFARDYVYFANIIRLVPVGFRKHPRARRQFSIADVITLRIVNGLSQYMPVENAGYIALALKPHIAEIAALDTLPPVERQRFVTFTAFGEVTFSDDPEEPVAGENLAHSIGPWPVVVLPIEATIHATVTDCMEHLRSKAHD